MIDFETTLTKVLSRKRSFLADDIAIAAQEIADAVKGAKILVIGAAGSIGSSFVNELLSYNPGGLHLIDISENNLVEVVRDLRSSGRPIPDDFQTFGIDFGRIEMRALLNSVRYDYILNFSALKHVRSERDPFTLMRLLDINILANQRLIHWIEESGQNLRRAFCVSSDKAVRSGNLMGASKAFMERVFLAHADVLPFSSARFANVAFSDGSLLHGFRHRLEKRQPIGAPNDVRRYFISPEEAGQLCLLGCFTSGNREIVYPLFKPEKDMMTFSQIARVFLEEEGLTALECESEEEALKASRDLRPGSKHWPCYFSGSDTSGEKPFEEFVDPSEESDEARYSTVGVVTSPVFHGAEVLTKAMGNLEKLREKGSWELEELVNIVSQAVPEMQHVAGGRNLDQKI